MLRWRVRGGLQQRKWYGLRVCLAPGASREASALRERRSGYRWSDECRHDGGLSSPSHLLICTALNSIFHESVVGITVQPTLAGLRGGDDWMPGGVRVFAGVLVWRAVTAERDTTCLAGPQMNP